MMDISYYKVKWEKWFFPDMPKAATMEEWSAWRKKARKQPVRWFFANTLPSAFTTYVYPLQRLLRAYRARYKVQEWRIDIPTLDKKSYHEVEIVMLHGMFHLLVKFVEIEKAWDQHASASFKDFDPMEDSWHQRIKHAKSRKKEWREANKRELALKHLDWEISLGKEGGKDQSKTAQEIKDLYLWWVDTRPNRPDPGSVVGGMGYSWDTYYEMKDKSKKNRDDFFDMMKAENDEEREIRRSVMDTQHEVEEQYAQEDQDMMIRLVKIRRGLWT